MELYKTKYVMKDEMWYIIWEIYMMKYNIRWNILWFNDETIFNTATEKRQASSTFETIDIPLFLFHHL